MKLLARALVALRAVARAGIAGMGAARAKITRKAIAHTLVLAGGGTMACGLALAYLPAGVMLGGLVLAAWALLIFDVNG